MTTAKTGSRNAALPLGSTIHAIDDAQIDRGSSWGAGLYYRWSAYHRQHLVTNRGVIVGVYPDNRQNQEAYLIALKHFSSLDKQLRP